MTYPLKLTMQNSKDVIARVFEDKILFYNSELESELRISGIVIPYSYQQSFEGKRVVEFSDPLFIKAFTEVYCPLELKKSGYTLSKSEGLDADVNEGSVGST